MTERIAVIGLGYVGLPVAVGFAAAFDDVIGFDINSARIEELQGGHDRTHEVADEVLAGSRLKFTDRLEELAEYTFYVVTVPTPIDENHVPDLTPLEKSSTSVGKVLSKGDVVVYESTVYPGVTEEFCGPILAQHSGLTQGVDFKLGYSPERINPGDKTHTLTRITKVVSGEDEETLNRVAAVYEAIIEAGIHRAPAIRVAEAAKVIENTQRDVNIALMNELALIFDRMGIRTTDVLAAAGTKWNFLPFTPGLVGGHCIGVDPYYLTAKAERLGYHPEVILSGRRINDGMGAFIAQRLIKMFIGRDQQIKGARVGVLGLTFKENVPDLRNSRVPDVIAELQEFGCEVVVHDPQADPHEAYEEYGVRLVSEDELGRLDAVILAVSHREYVTAGPQRLVELLGGDGVVVDVKSLFAPHDFSAPITYWSL